MPKKINIRLDEILNGNLWLYENDIKKNLETQGGRITISDLAFKEEELIDFHSTIYNKIILQNCTFHENLVLKPQHQISLFFENCSINKSLSVHEQNFAIEIVSSKVNHINIEGKLLQSRNLKSKISLSKNSIIEEITVSSSIQTILINDCQIKKYAQQLYIENLQIVRSKLESIEIENCESMNIHIQDKSSVDHLALNGKSVGVLSIEKSTVNALVLSNINVSYFIIESGSTINYMSDIRLNQIQDLIFKHSTFNRIAFGGDSGSKSKVRIENNTISALEFTSFKNETNFRLKENSFPSAGVLIFDDSDLGSMTILSSDFSSCIVKFDNTKISDAYVSDVDFPVIIYDVRKQNCVNHIQAKQLFGTLNGIYDKNGDSVREYEYHAREIHEYYKSISLWSDKWLSKATLWLNYQSNNFGRDWGKGIRFTLVVSIIGFQLMLLASGYTWTFEFNPALAISFLKFVNPIRVIDIETLLKRENIGWEAYLVDFICRILIAYGYFQTIQAFRKFGKQ